MGVLQWVVQPLSPFTQTGVSYSAIYDVMDAQEVHGLLKVTAIVAGTLDAVMQTSVDATNWSTCGTAYTQVTTTLSAAMASQVRSASGTSIYRFVRFQYSLATGPITFEAQLFVKTLS